MAAEKKISLAVKTLNGEDAGKVEVSADVFGVTDVNPQVIKDAVTVYQANLRQATAKTKKRHEVHGTNQNYKLSQNKKAHNLALRGVLSEKVAEGGIVVIDSLQVEKVSTKGFAGHLTALGLAGKKNLVVTEFENENVVLSARNIDKLVVTTSDNISVYDVLYFDNIIVSKDGIKNIEEALK